MGWLEIDSVSKMYRRRKPLFGAIDIEEDDQAGEVEDPDADEEKALTESVPTEGREIWALRDVNLRIDSGDAVVVVGLGGSGKTTLIRILAGLSLPTSGEVRGQGFVIPLNFVRNPILATATGRQNLALLESLLGMAKGRILDRASEIASFAGLERHLDQKVSQYSRSMYSKLALAAGLFCDPGILLIDDGIPSGDPPFRARVAEKLEELVRQGATLVYASQTASDLASSLCRRAVWLSNGGVVQDGPAEEVLHEYQVALDQIALDAGGSEDLHEAVEVVPAVTDELEPKAARQKKVRLVPERSWLAKADKLEKRWQRALRRWRAEPSEKQKRQRSGIYYAERSSLAKVIDIRVVDSEGRRMSLLPPGEPVRAEIEIDVFEPHTEIGVRIEVDTREARLFASDLPVPFCPDKAGRYLLSFPLPAWLTQQEVEDRLLYKIRAKTFFRSGTTAWEDMNVGTVHLRIWGTLRQRFLAASAAGEPALSDLVPTWLDAAEPRPSEEALARKPLMRPQLDWEIYRVEAAGGDEAQTETAQRQPEERKERAV